MASAMSASLIGSPKRWPGLEMPEGLSYGPGGAQSCRWLRTAPTCQSCGAIRPPAACTASITRFQPASSASPWNFGMFGSFSEAGRATPVPSETIRPTPAAARRA